MKLKTPISMNGYIWLQADGTEMGFEWTPEIIRRVNAHDKLIAAAKAVREWYERDGSVGGACDPMEQLEAAIAEGEAIGAPPESPEQV